YGTQAQVELQVAGHLVGGIKTTAKNLGGLSTGALYLTTEGAYPVVIGTNMSSSPTLAVGATAGGVSIGNNYIATDPGAGNLIVSGNVGIGTTNPQSKLAVNGTINTKEVVVTAAGWSDYVFDKDRQLAPLSEVATFIDENHHLPGIPSAAEVAEKGVSLGEMQAKLLAKIEELTLHMIDEEKHNRQVEQENQDLRKRIEALESKSVQRREQ